MMKALTVVRLKHTLPDLPYDFASLEPIISVKTMSSHYQGHHLSFVNNLNKIQEELNESIKKCLKFLYLTLFDPVQNLQSLKITKKINYCLTMLGHIFDHGVCIMFFGMVIIFEI